jgi:hypothetical protein
MDIATATKTLQTRAAAVQRSKETQREKLMRELLEAAQQFVTLYQRADANARVRMILGLEGDEAALYALVRYMYACAKNSAAAMTRSLREAETIVASGIAAYVIIADRLPPTALKKAEDALVAQADRLNIPLDTFMADAQPPQQAYLATAESMAEAYYRDGAIHAVGHLLRMFPHVEHDKKIMEAVSRISGLTPVGALRDLPDHYLRAMYIRDRVDRAPHIVKAADLEVDGRDALDVAPIPAQPTGKNVVGTQAITAERYSSALQDYAKAQRDPNAPLHIGLGLAITVGVLAGLFLLTSRVTAMPDAQLVDLLGLIVGGGLSVALGLAGISVVFRGELSLPRRLLIPLRLTGLAARTTGWMLFAGMLLVLLGIVVGTGLLTPAFLADRSLLLRVLITGAISFPLAFITGILIRLANR